MRYVHSHITIPAARGSVKPPSFEYEAPDNVEEVLTLLAASGGAAKVIAGGQSLMPMLNFRFSRPEVLVDIGRIESGQSLTISGGILRIPFGVTQADVLARPGVETFNPLLTQALRLVGHAQTRARGTVVGSLVHADPAAELPAVMVSLNARIELMSVRGARWIDACEFFVGPFSTALREDELASAVELRGCEPNERPLFREVARRHGDFASVGLATLASIDDGTLTSVRFVAFGAFPTPRRLVEAERAAVDDPASLRDAVFETTAESAEDLHASSDLRRQQLAVIAERSLEELLASSGR
jgi:aerobic carbon-monoxide dehydrogenase medium subunit